MRAALVLPWLLLSGLAAPAAAADAIPPTFSNFAVTDCEGNFQTNSAITSTGVASFRIAVRDQDNATNPNPGMGLRVGRTQHIGGGAAPSSLLLHLHLDDAAVGAGATTTASSTTLAHTITVSDLLNDNVVTPCHTGLAGDRCFNWQGTASGDDITINADASLNSTTSQLTLQAWIFPANLTQAPILEYGNAFNSGPHLWHGVPGNNGELFANLVDTFGVNHVIASTGGFVKVNEWQLVTLTFNGSVAKLFHNHVLVATQTFTGLDPLQTSYPFVVGRRKSSTAVFNGAIDEVRVYNTALSDDEVDGDIYSGVFSHRTTSTASVPFTRTQLVPATHYTPPTFADGDTVISTINVGPIALKAGAANTVSFSFQDKVGNTRKTTTPMTVIESVPDAPSLLAAAPASATQLDWTWNRGTRLCRLSGSAGHFRVYNAATNAVVVTSQPVASYSRPAVGINTIFGVRVSAVDDFGESPLTPSASAYTLAEAPTGLLITSISTGSAVLSWASTNPNYTRFEVSISPDNFVNTVSSPASFSSNLTGVTTGLLALSPQTTYDVRVRAINGRAGDAATPGTNLTGFLTGTFTTLPSPPGSLVGAAAGSSSILWTWTAVPTATSYTLESDTGTNLAVTAGLNHTVTNLNPNALFGARLRANNASGSGTFGPVVTLFTDPRPPTGTQVTNVATATIRTVWNANGNPANTSYQVQVSTRADFSSLSVAVSVTSTETSVGGLLTSTGYFARVRASGFSGSGSAFDTVVSFTTDQFASVSSTPTPPTPYAFRSQTVAVYHFDESGGTRAADATQFLNHGTMSGVIGGSTPTFVPGQAGLGNAGRFPGISDGVMTVPHAASLVGTGDVTVQAWLNPTAVNQVQDAGVVVKGSGTDETFILDVSSNSRWRFGVRSAAGTLFTVFSTQSLRAGEWVHVAGVYKSGGAPSLSMYVDGNLSNTMTSAPTTRRATAGSLSVGSRRSGTTSFDRSFRGDIDEVHIETAAVTAAQIGGDYASARPSIVTPPSPNDGLRITIPPNALGGAGVILISSSPLTVPIEISPQILSDGIASPPTGQTLVPGSIFEIVATVSGNIFTGNLGSTVTLAIPYPDADSNGLVDGTFPPIPAQNLKVYTLNPAVTRWEALPSSVDTANRRVLGLTSHFSIFALFGPTGIKPNTDQVRVYPRPWRPGSGGKFDSVAFAGHTGLAIDNLPSSGSVRIFTLSGELVRDIGFGASNAGTLIWNGLNHAGLRTASGVYFALVRGDDGSQTVVKFAIER
ncbi:MAG: fibronectin type III domain-containing protein [Elusimicrobia bacterium]|nr:fibronectin type III domain-containing protein [Elusimicrobiota bacterium]